MLYYIGRNDHQIKLLGLRIVKQEISKVAQAFSDCIISTCLNIVNGDSLYMWVESGADINDRELREYMGCYLPAWMVPSRFITLSSFPSLPNGKLDVSSLMAIRNINTCKTGSMISAGFEEVRPHWNAITGVALDADLLSQGVNSLHCIRAARMIPDRYRVNLSSAAIIRSVMGKRLGSELFRAQSGLSRERLTTKPVKCPVYVIATKQDRLRSLEETEALAALTRACLDYVEGCGHLIPLEKPDELAQLVPRWLNEKGV